MNRCAALRVHIAESYDNEDGGYKSLKEQIDIGHLCSAGCAGAWGMVFTPAGRVGGQMDSLVYYTA